MSKSSAIWACPPAPRRAPRRSDSIYSKRPDESKTACQRKATAPLAVSASKRRPKEPFAHLPTALRPSRLVQQWVFYQAEKELTSLAVLRYGSGHRKRWFKNPIHSTTRSSPSWRNQALSTNCINPKTAAAIHSNAMVRLKQQHLQRHRPGIAGQIAGASELSQRYNVNPAG